MIKDVWSGICGASFPVWTADDTGDFVHCGIAMLESEPARTPSGVITADGRIRDGVAVEAVYRALLERGAEIELKFLLEKLKGVVTRYVKLPWCSTSGCVYH